MDRSFSVSKESFYALIEPLMPYLIAGVAVVFALLAILILAVLSESRTGDLRLDVIEMDIRERFENRWFTVERVSQKLLPHSDPNYVQEVLNTLVRSGEVKVFTNRRTGRRLYHFA